MNYSSAKRRTCKGWHNSLPENLQAHTQIHIPHCLNQDGESITIPAIVILERFRYCYREVDRYGTGLVIMVNGRVPRSPKGKKKGTFMGANLSFRDHRTSLSLTGNRYGDVRKLQNYEDELQGILDGFYEEVFSGDSDQGTNEDLLSFDPSPYLEEGYQVFNPSPYSHARKMQGMIHRRIGEYLCSVQWALPNDALIALAILNMGIVRGSAYLGYGGYETEGILVNAAQRDIEVLTNISAETISRRSNFLHRGSYPVCFWKKGTRMGHSSEFLLLPSKEVPYLLRTNTKESETDPLLITASTSTRSSVVIGFSTPIHYSPLNPSNKFAILHLLAFGETPEEALKCRMGYFSPIKKFRQNVLTPLQREHGLVEREDGMVRLVPDFKERIGEMFDRRRYEENLKRIEAEQDRRMDEILHTPMAEFRRLEDDWLL